MVPLEHHHLALPQEVVPHLLLAPPDLEVAAKSSQCLLLLFSEPWSATSTEPPHTALGCPCPRYATTCPRALPVASPPSGDEYPQTLPQPQLKDHVMALTLTSGARIT
jgi:hypothetical protein